MRRRLVVESAVVRPDAELFNQPKRGEQLRFAENRFRENLLVKEIQASRPEINQIDQQNHERDNDRDHDPKEILQHGLKHNLPSGKMRRGDAADSTRFAQGRRVNSFNRGRGRTRLQSWRFWSPHALIRQPSAQNS